MAKPKGTVICPACESEIGPEGKTLVKRSEKLAELQKLEKSIPELEKEITRLETETKETKQENADLRKSLEEKTKGEGRSGKQPWFRRGSR